MKKGLACMLALAVSLAAQSPVDSSAKPSSVSEIEQLKQMLMEQQRQINELRQKLGMPVNAGVPVNSHAGIGEVASTTPVLPPAPVEPPVFTATAPTPAPAPQPGSSDASCCFGLIKPGPKPGETAWGDTSAPLELKIGDAYITPVGFMDMTSVTRSTNTGSGIGTNFGSIPYGNTQAGALTESRLSPQNSRIGARIDAAFHDFKVMGYWESDFLGQLSSPPNGGLAVSSNPYVFRLRVFWVDVQKGKNEFLAGQSWSLMTPNRKGISPLPADIFYSQDVDVNYQLGLTWGRIPGFRYVYHASDKTAFAIALENSEPYVGGGNGGSGAVLPAAISTTNAISGSVLGGQINNGSSQIQASALMPDIIAKLAFDPSSRFHGEVVGVMIANKIAYPITGPAFPTNTKVGGGVSLNLGFDIAPNVRVLTNNFYSNGGGRYIFGQAPDFIIRADGTMSLVHSASTATGLEVTAGKTLLYGYYGGVYISKNMALDANGTTKIGYGSIASDGQNRAIQEITFGTNTTLARSVKWGALNLMFQYSYLQRNPWLVTGTSPTNAHLSMGFVNLRYTLPGAPVSRGATPGK
jgi:hypothetical protein